MATEKQSINCCALVCGSRDFDKTWLKKQLRLYDNVIAADSGYDNCILAGIVPSVIIGDFDSIQNAPDENIKRITYPSHKDETDFELCLRYCSENGYKNVDVFCALGGRPDHTMAAVFAGANAKKSFDALCIKDGNTDIFFVDKQLSLSAVDGYVSVFAIGENAEGVTLKGFEYPLKSVTLSCCVPLGTSNKTIADKAEISLKHGTLAVVIVRNQI